jgi:hypothetical protein
MSATDVEIANLAMSHLGLTVNVSTIVGVVSKEERAVSRSYVTVRNMLQKRYPWKFNSFRATLVAVDSLVAAEVTTLDEWSVAYVQPADCLAPIRIVTGIRNESVDQRAAFDVGVSDTGATNVLLCDVSPCVIQYRKKITDCTKFSPGFDYAFSHALAVELCMPLRVDVAVTKLAMQRARLALEEALADERSVGVPDLPPEADHIRARS